MARQCLSCGNDIKFWEHKSKQYCDEKCKDDYHNAQRKIQRKKHQIYKAIGDLQRMRDETQSDSIRQEINDTLDILNVAID
jgi:L-lactate utilization protein LutB